MRRLYIGICAAVVLLVSVGQTQAVAPPPRPEPLRGAITKGAVVTCVWQRSYVYFWFQRLSGRKAEGNTFVDTAIFVPLRWHASFGALWVAGGAPPVMRKDMPGGEGPMRYELVNLLKGRMVPAPGAREFTTLGPPGVANAIPLSNCRFLACETKFTPVVHYDYLPAGQLQIKLIIITNLATQGLRSSSSGNLSATLLPGEPQKAPKWSFVCHSLRARWNSQDEMWDIENWKEEESIELRFREPFQALARGDDYYFVTDSGKLYRAPKPAKGKQRKLLTVWDEPKAPIKAFITDADNNRTFLFCERGRKGEGGPCVFELADGVRLRPFDKSLFKPGSDGPTALRRVVGYARVLETLGFVKSNNLR